MDPSRRVVVTGDDDVLETLAGLIPGPVRLIRDVDGWALVAPEIDVAPTPITAMDAADVIVAHLAGVARLELGRSVSLKASSYVRLWHDGRRDVHAFVTDAITANAFIVGGTDGPPPVAAKTITEIAMANRDQEPVMLVLELWAQRPTWPSLHKIVEVIKADMGGARRFARLAPTGQLRRFSQTANAYENALEGRHAVKDYRLPTSEDPMPLSEATTLISDLTKTWLRTKA